MVKEESRWKGRRETAEGGNKVKLQMSRGKEENAGRGGEWMAGTEKREGG